VVFDTVFDYTLRYEAASAAHGRPPGVREHPVTRAAADTLAARRRRAVAERSATLSAAGVEPAGTGDPPAAGPAAARADLVVLLPSADAATVLLLCAQAAEPSG
jgi:hypothetical protein